MAYNDIKNILPKFRFKGQYVSSSELTSGNITAREMQLGLSAGVALSVGLAMIRILTGVSILWLLIPGYALALALTFFVSDVFTGVAFDSSLSWSGR